MILLLILLSTITFADTRTHNLPNGFQWRYVMDENEPSARFGQFWRSGVLLEDRLIVLNSHTLIALDFQGKELWKMGLKSENHSSEAKIISTDHDEIIVVTTDALLQINTENGKLIDHYGYDSKKGAAFQFTELLPRTAILFGDYVYVFLGPQLLAFHKKTLHRETIFNFNSSPKTLPVIYDNKFIIGFLNGFVEMFDPTSKQKQTLSRNDNIRQIIIDKQLIFIPSNKSIKVYSNTNFFAESDQFPDNVLSSANGKIWLRQHNKGSIHQIDETLSSLQKIFFINDRIAGKITSPMVGYENILLNIDTTEGQIFVIENSLLKKTIYSEEFMDNPPIQFLDQKENIILLGGFDGLYYIDLNTI